MTWVLILWIHAGPFSDHDSMALVRVPGFATAADCERAGLAAERWTIGTAKRAKFQCAQVLMRPPEAP